MIPKRMSDAEIEQAYDLIADGVDAAGPEKAPLFLAKLALCLADLVADPALVAEAVACCARDLAPEERRRT
jgi:hypothetical protein